MSFIETLYLQKQLKKLQEENSMLHNNMLSFKKYLVEVLLRGDEARRALVSRNLRGNNNIGGFDQPPTDISTEVLFDILRGRGGEPADPESLRRGGEDDIEPSDPPERTPLSNRQLRRQSEREASYLARLDAEMAADARSEEGLGRKIGGGELSGYPVIGNLGSQVLYDHPEQMHRTLQHYGQIRIPFDGNAHRAFVDLYGMPEHGTGHYEHGNLGQVSSFRIGDHVIVTDKDFYKQTSSNFPQAKKSFISDDF